MKISYSDLKNAYARLSAMDIKAVLANSRNVSLADIKDYSSKISNKILKIDFIFFSKYTPFLAILLYSIIVIPLTFSTYRSVAEKQRLNKQYELERSQIETLTSTLISIESQKSELQGKQTSISSLLLSPDQVDQLPFAIDDLSKMHNIKIDEFNFLSINDFSAALSGDEDIFSADTAMDPSLDPGLDPSLDPGLDPSLDPGLDPSLDPGLDPSLDPGLDPSLDPGLDPSLDPGLDPSLDPGLDPSLDPDISTGSISINNSREKVVKKSEEFEETVRIKLTANGDYVDISSFISDLTKLRFYSFVNSIVFESFQEQSQSGATNTKGLAKVTLLMTIPLLEQ